MRSLAHLPKVVVHLLVAAEKSSLLGRDAEAAELYDRAIEAALAYGYLNNAALANEAAAKFWQRKGKDKFAGLYMTDAWNLYRQWGATAKAQDGQS